MASSDFKAVCVNVRGIVSNHKRTEFFNMVLSGAVFEMAEFVVLCETKADAEVSDSCERQWKRVCPQGWSVWSPVPADGSDNGAGVAVLYCPRGPGPLAELVESFSKGGRLAAAKVKVEGGLLVSLWSLYAPATPGKRVKFFKGVDLLPARFPNPLVGGDFNVPLVLGADMLLERGVSAAALAAKIAREGGTELQAVMRRFRLVDAFRVSNPSGFFGTHRNNADRMDSHRRLDMWLVSTALSKSFRGCSILNTIYADHNAVLVALSLSDKVQPRRGPGQYRISKATVADARFLDQVHRHVAAAAQVGGGGAGAGGAGAVPVAPGEGPHGERLEKVLAACSASGRALELMEFRRLKKLSRQKARRVEQLRAQVAGLASVKPGDVALLRRLRQAEENFRVMLGEQYARWARRRNALLRRECCGATKAFYMLGLPAGRNQPRAAAAKAAGSRSGFIDVITSRAGAVVEGQTFVAAELVGYWADIMNSNNGLKVDPVKLKMVMEKVSVKVTAAQAAVLDADITLAELEAALKQCAREAAPGADGLTVVFWLALWKELGPLLLLAAQEGWEAGRFRDRFNMAVIVLLLKKDKSRLLCGDWRPVSLLNWAYKIVTKVVSMRLNVVLPSLVSSKQSAWVKGRSVHDTITIIQGVIKLSAVDPRYKDAAILFLDLVKAFDTVAWRVIFDFVLPGFGFPAKFINLIRALYAGAGSKILLNGFLSELFRITCGVRQGDSLSPPLFALFVELFALAFECVPSARPLLGPLDIPVGVEMYADDITVITQLQDLPATKTVLELFVACTGMSFGEAGSSVVFVPGREGDELSVAHRQTIADLGFKLLDGAGRHRSLGMVIGHGVGNAELLLVVLEKMAASQARYAPYHLEVLARVMVSKVYMLSFLNFLAAVVDWDPVPLQAVRSFISGWVWAGRTARLDEAAACLPTRDGGLGMFALEEAMMSRRIRQLLRATTGNPMAARMGQFVVTELLGPQPARFHGVQGLLSAGVLKSALASLPRGGGFSVRRSLLLALQSVVVRAVPRSVALPLGAAQPGPVLPHPPGVVLPGGPGWEDAASFSVFDVPFPVAGGGVRVFSPAFLPPPGGGDLGALRVWDAERLHASLLAQAGVRRVGDLCFQHGAVSGQRLSLHGCVLSRLFPVGGEFEDRRVQARVSEFDDLADAVPAALFTAMAAGPSRTPLPGDFYLRSGQAAFRGGRPAAVILAERRWAGHAAEADEFAGEESIYRVSMVRGAAAGVAASVELSLCMIMSDCVVVELPLEQGEPVLSVRLPVFQELFRLAIVTSDHRYAGVVAEGAAVGRSLGVAFPAAGGGGLVVVKALFELSGKRIYKLLREAPPGAASVAPVVPKWESDWFAAESEPPPPGGVLLGLGPALAAGAGVAGAGAGGVAPAAAVFPGVAAVVVAGGPAVAAVRSASWPVSIKLRGAFGSFHLLQSPGLLSAYQRELLLWVYLRRVWSNERCWRILHRGAPGCLVCGGAVECLRHLFWDCPAVREGWRMVLSLFADLRGRARPNLAAASSWSSSRYVASVLGSSPEWPVATVPASRKESLIWLVLKAELLSCIWRLRCRLIQDGVGPGPVAVVVPHSGAEIVGLVRSALRHRVMEERYLPSDGLVFEDWMARGAFGKVDGALGGAISFSPLLGGVSRWMVEREDPNAPDHLFAGLPVIH